MKIRDYEISDYPRIKELADKYKINLPYEGKLIVAEDKNGEIKAFANIRLVPMIEPFISENTMIGNKLWNYIEEKTRKGGVKITRCFTESKNEGLFKRLGFYRIFNKHCFMEKSYNQEVQ